MILRHKMLHFIILVVVSYLRCILGEESTQTKLDLVESESKDSSKVEIIKQIKRVNDDGSYTFGYEAEDGTFKIESRDVLGNIKGTYGFVDSDGEIKRVSYSTTNSTEPTTVTSLDTDRVSVIQQIPRTNRTISTTKRPPHPYLTPNPSSTVIQSIPRRRLSSSNSSGNISGSTATTVRPSFLPTRSSMNTDSTKTIMPSQRSPRPTANYIRAPVISQAEIHGYTERQLIRPVQSESVTLRPTEKSYSRSLTVTRNPFLDDSASSTIKPITEESNDGGSVRGNLLRRQLDNEKLTANFNTRQHIINLQQSAGDDSTDVYSASLTTGTPRPLFTNSNRLRPSTLNKAKDLVTPANYQAIYQKNVIRSPKLTSHNSQETTTDATNAQKKYVEPNQIQVIQIPDTEEPSPQLVRTKHPFHQGAILIPVNQFSNERYVIDNTDEEVNKRHYLPQYSMPSAPEYIRENVHHFSEQRLNPIPYSIISRSRPVQIPIEDYQHNKPNPSRAFPISIPSNSEEFQDEIDHIKPPVSTRDFQKLLNRLILRQSQLQEVTRIENSQMSQQRYLQQQQYSTAPFQPAPVSVFVRTETENMENNGPIQFLSQMQASRGRQFIPVSQSQQPSSQLLESKQQYNIRDVPGNYAHVPLYRSGRRVARLFIPEANAKRENSDIYLPADVREMLLLRMLQLAINPNLPLQPKERDSRLKYKKEAVRNVEILGEDQEEVRQVSRNKRYREYDEYEYY